jgi:hypothetical protein
MLSVAASRGRLGRVSFRFREASESNSLGQLSYSDNMTNDWPRFVTSRHAFSGPH